MTDYEALLRGVLLAPADDLPRLVLADWLEEHGQGDTAQFIRYQCSNHDSYVRFGSQVTNSRFSWKPMDWKVAGKWKRGARTSTFCLPLDFIYQSFAVVRRGFVDRISTPSWIFMKHAKAIFESCPIKAVTLFTREPREVRRNPDPYSADLIDDVGEAGEWYWRCWNDTAGADIHHNLHSDLFPEEGKVYPGEEHLRFFSSRDEALAALSRRCVAYGRKLAKLEEQRG